ncbi:hypothetical protein CEXT_73951 [Caerostris extrusa]|uniref:Uncharacterized protein n=1 Tax=Caerostris extrusa TaxID=172846 RepID=A0AAV4N7F2_CAEEX|nr:hypothetical protein CEXT_73951 [Caerostris extrusa]
MSLHLRFQCPCLYSPIITLLHSYSFWGWGPRKCWYGGRDFLSFYFLTVKLPTHGQNAALGQGPFRFDDSCDHSTYDSLVIAFRFDDSCDHSTYDSLVIAFRFDDSCDHSTYDSLVIAFRFDDSCDHSTYDSLVIAFRFDNSCDHLDSRPCHCF